MTKIFSPDSRVMAILTKLAYSCMLNVLWFVCSLPVITIGASTTALYAVTVKMARDEEGNVFQAYFTEFRRNFGQATRLWLVLLAGLVLLGADGYVLFHIWNQSPLWTGVTAVYLVALAAFVIVLMYAFPLNACFQNTVKQTLVNSLLIGMRFLVCTALMAGVYFLMALVAVRFFTPILFFGMGLCAMLNSWILNGVLRLCEEKAKEETEN